MGSRGQSEVLATVILIAVVLVLAAVFIIISMINFSKASASTSLSLAESFMTNVADDLEASMYNPGTTLVYPLPATQYGVFNFIGDYCNVTVGGVTYNSGALIYGVPPGYNSLPSGYVQVVRGSLANGAYNAISESLIIENAAAPLISIVQFGASRVNGVSYGTYVVLFPRVLVINEASMAYVYIPVIKVVPSGLRSVLIVNVTGIYTYTISGGAKVSVSDVCGSLSSSLFVSADTLRVVIVNVTMTFR